MNAADSSEMTQLLTEREQSVLQGMARGLTDQDIANDLDLSIHTIKWYARRIYQKLDVKRRTQAVSVARSNGLLHDDRLPPDNSILVSPEPIIGRADEIKALFRLLTEEEIRLVTIIGPGGIGKTQLALEVAQQWQDRTSSSSCFISLENITDPEDIPRVIANTIGMQFSGPSPPAHQVLNRLSYLSGLLILDNFEHLLVAAPFVSEILGASPNLTILVTSRERLNIQPETMFSLDGLAYSTQNVSVEELSAIQLFCRTVRRIKPEFVPDEDQLRNIADICLIVEGMPLAIILAAGWTRVLPLSAIADELKSNLSLLRSSMRDLPRRHRNMRLVFEGSWKLTSEQERAVFKKLTVFHGGFDRRGAEAVAGASLPVIRGLLDKSLLMQAEGDRYRIHTLLRQFGAEKLHNDPGDLHEQALDAHCRYYASLMAGYGKTVIKRMNAFMRVYLEMKADTENILAAWRHALERPMIDEIGCFSYSIAHHYGALGLNEQGRKAMLRALEQYRRFPDQGTIRDRIVILTAAGWFSSNITRYQEGLRYLEAAQELAEEIEACSEGDSAAHVGLMKAYLSHVLIRAEENARARAVGEEALRFCRDAAYEWGEWVSLMVLGDLEAGEGLYEKALERHQQAFALAKGTQYAVGMAYSLPAVGMDYCAIGEIPPAIKAFRNALRVNRELFVTDPVLMTLVGMAMLAFHQGAYRGALDLAAILHYDLRCGGSPRLRNNQLLKKLRRKVPRDVYDAVMDRADRGLISTPIVDSNFSLEPALIDHLLHILEEQSCCHQK